MEYNSDFRYDLKVGQTGEELLGKILNDSTIEVKKDLKAHVTGNIFIEYESRGKASGIAKSEAYFYAFIINNDRIIMIDTCQLKKLCRPYYGTKRDKKGGDNNSSKGILLPVKDLISFK